MDLLLSTCIESRSWTRVALETTNFILITAWLLKLYDWLLYDAAFWFCSLQNADRRVIKSGKQDGDKFNPGERKHFLSIERETIILHREHLRDAANFRFNINYEKKRNLSIILNISVQNLSPPELKCNWHRKKLFLSRHEHHQTQKQRVSRPDELMGTVINNFDVIIVWKSVFSLFVSRNAPIRTSFNHAECWSRPLRR